MSIKIKSRFSKSPRTAWKDRSQYLSISSPMFKSVSDCHGFLSRKTGAVPSQAFRITVKFWHNEYVLRCSRRYSVDPCISRAKKLPPRWRSGYSDRPFFRWHLLSATMEGKEKYCVDDDPRSLECRIFSEGLLYGVHLRYDWPLVGIFVIPHRTSNESRLIGFQSGTYPMIRSTKSR